MNSRKIDQSEARAGEQTGKLPRRVFLQGVGLGAGAVGQAFSGVRQAVLEAARKLS